MIILYIVGGLVVAFLLFQYSMVFKMRLQKGKPAPEVGGKAGRAIQGGRKALFYFYSPGCRACKQMTPIIEKLSENNKSIVKIDISLDMTTAKKFGVMGTPSTVLVQAGKIAEFLVGPQTEDRILALLGKS
ncbi:MAG: conjugal transfer protein TraF [Actinobacteria bacterium]|nr:conjugal transfer protein TraF [Actinomycetota bacterium]